MKKYLLLSITFFIALLLIVFIFNIKSRKDNNILIFVQDGCIHCIHAEEFIKNNQDLLKNHNINILNLKEEKNYNLLIKYVKKFNLDTGKIGTPTIFYRDKYIVGWGEKNKNDFIEMIRDN